MPTLGTTLLCPSTPASPGVEGVLLTGIVGPDGHVAHLLTPLPVTADFLTDVERAGRPEDRFRFAAPCAHHRCENWQNQSCSLIGRLRDAIHPSEDTPLPKCGIRSTCRWHAQDGRRACQVCPQVTYNP